MTIVRESILILQYRLKPGSSCMQQLHVRRLVQDFAGVVLLTDLVLNLRPIANGKCMFMNGSCGLVDNEVLVNNGWLMVK